METENLPVTALLQYFEKIFPLNNQEREEIAKNFTERSVKRRAMILQQDDICKHFTFVVKGCFKMYVVDMGGKEHNLQFAVENDWITDLSSFYAAEPSNVYIEAMEHSVVLQIKHDDLLELYIKYHKFDRNFRIIVERKYIELQNRMLQNISLTANIRYIQFIKKNPHLANRLPGSQIASYLGITPEFLSKVKKEIAHK